MQSSPYKCAITAIKKKLYEVPASTVAVGALPAAPPGECGKEIHCKEREHFINNYLRAYVWTCMIILIS